MRANRDIDQKHQQLLVVCRERALTLMEYQLLNCCLDGQMTDNEIRKELGLTVDELNEIVEGLRANALVGRRKGVLVTSIEGRSALHSGSRRAA